jgi:hypothetical protein
MWFKSEDEKAAAVAELRFDGATIESLGLDFTLPGSPLYQLKVVAIFLWMYNEC